MESLKKVQMLEFAPNALQAVRAKYGLDKPGQMNEAIDILETWIKQQQHFTKREFPRDYLERQIIFRKGSVERAKETLDKLCTFRTLLPSFFLDIDTEKYFDVLKHKVKGALLPKQTEDFSRILIAKVYDDKFVDADLMKIYNINLTLVHHLKINDYSSGVIVVLDYLDTDLTEIVMNMNLTDFRNSISIIVEGFGLRINGVHILTKAKSVGFTVKMIKPMLPPKVGDRLHVHNNIEAIYDFVAKDILPAEYGGKEKSLKELFEEELKILNKEENREYRREINEARTDESLRQADVFNQYMGLPGTFRTLNVD